MSDSTFTDRKVIEMSRNFVNVIAHQEVTHGAKEVFVGREKAKLCSEYHTIPCDTHVKGWSAVGRFFQGSFGAPSAVFCEPGGKELFKHTGGMSGGELVKKMTEAFGKVSGDKVPLVLWNQGQLFLKDAEAALEKSDYKKSIDAYTRLSKIKCTIFKDKSREALEKIDTAGDGLLAEALLLATPEEKKKALRKIVDDFKTLPVAAKAKKELDSIK